MDKERIKIENSGREEMRATIPLSLGDITATVILTTGAQVNDGQLYIYRYDINEAIIRALTEDFNETVVVAAMDPRLAKQLHIGARKMRLLEDSLRQQRIPGPDDKEIALNQSTVFLINGLPTFVTLSVKVSVVPRDTSDQAWVLIHDAVSTVLLRNLTEANISRHMKK